MLNLGAFGEVGTLLKCIKCMVYGNFIRKGWLDSICNFRFVVGQGTRDWCDDVALEEAFPSLFRIVFHKEASVAEYMDTSNAWCGGMLTY